MKRQIRFATQLALFSMLLVCLSGCFKDHCTHTYTLYKPILASLTEARANMKSNAPVAVKQPGKIYLYGNYIFMNENNRGIHVIDNSQPTNPKNIAFITIPGNVDMAVKGNIMYADSYSDMVAFDISNPKQVVAKKFLNNVFPHRNQYYNSNSSNPDSVKIIVDWETRDTTVDCDTYQRLYSEYYALASADTKGYYSSPQAGVGGSMACFTLVNDYLYTVSSTNLSSFDLSVPQDPVFKNTKSIGWGVETIYPFKEKLFIGTTTGMFIYDVSNPASPSQVAQYSHVRSCDPVIADGDNAYVTLRTGTTCAGNINQLDVLSISSVNSPSLLKTYPMTNPHGLSKDGDLLFICDGTDGLKVYDASAPMNLKLLKKVSGIRTFDVIAWNKKAIVVGDDGLYQFDYSNSNDIRLLSKITLSK